MIKRLIILFAVSSIVLLNVAFASAPRSEAGGTSYNDNGGYHSSDYSREDGFDWTDLYAIHVDDPSWLTQLRYDARDGNLSNEFKLQADEFLKYWNYTHYFKTTESIPGDEFTSDTWQIPYEFRVTVQYRYSYIDYPDQGSFWASYANLIIDPFEEYSISSTDPWGAAYSLDYSQGKLSYDFDFTGLSGVTYEGDIRVQTYAYFNGYPGIIRVLSPSPVGTFLTAGSNCYITDGNTVNITSNPILFYAHVGNSSYIQYYWSDYVFGGVTAPDPPLISYPTTYNNNYYDKEVNYYNYMTNAVDTILDEGVTNDFLDDVTDWGLLSLPPGLALECLDALGDYSSVCEFHFDGIYVPVSRDKWFRVPEMHFEFDADNYSWLLPFRYLIALSLALTIAYWAYGLVASALNWGEHL